MIKEITVEVKKSKNFQTYTCGETITITEEDQVKTEYLREQAMARCRSTVMKQMEIDFPK